MSSAALKPPPPKPANTSWAAPEDDLDDEGWEDMPIIRAGDNPLGLDEEDEKKYHYQPPEKLSGGTAGNATGNLIDYDESGHEWRAKLEQNENDYTRLRLDEDDEAEEAYLKTKYLFDEDKAMTPLSQMQQTKNMLTEAQRIAYVGVCSLTIREMIQTLKNVGAKELKAPVHGMELWGMRIMGRLYYHMELETPEQKMIESLAEHGVTAADLVPPLMTTHTVRNPEYDPVEAAQKVRHDEEEKEVQEKEEREKLEAEGEEDEDVTDLADDDLPAYSPNPPTASDKLPDPPLTPQTPHTPSQPQTTANVLTHHAPVSVPGVSTSLSATDENVTLDIRWTVLCDLFLMLIADSVYDARSRVLMELIAAKMGLGWLDVVKFEKRVTDALEIQEGTETLEQRDIISQRDAASRKRRYAMIGLATIGGGLVLGLSAGILAPVIGAGLGAALGTVGISGTTAFLGSAGGAAVITTAGTLTGSGIAAKGMSRRTQQVHTFEILPTHNNKRVNCILTVPGFMSNHQDDVRLPFSVLDPIVGDVFSVLWEPEMMGETGNALKILTTEVLSQVGQTVLQATVMTALMSAIQWPLVLTKLGYLIDNPWSNALDRAVSAGGVLADTLIKRHLGVRPITLIGFSLGARVIYYALLELAKHKAYGIVQDVFLLGATVAMPTKSWLQIRGVVSGRLVNGYARNDWILNYLFRATSGVASTVAGLRPVLGVPGLENVDVTDKISGHMSYRVFMPIILDQLGFPVSATYFDEPEDLEERLEKEYQKAEEARLQEELKSKPKGRFNFWKRKSTAPPNASRPPTATSWTSPRTSKDQKDDDDLPERMDRHSLGSQPDAKSAPVSPMATTSTPPPDEDAPNVPKKAGFDFDAIGKALGKDGLDPNLIKMPIPSRPVQVTSMQLERSESAPPPQPDGDQTPTATPRLLPRKTLGDDSGDYAEEAPRIARAASSIDETHTSAISPFASSAGSSKGWSSNGWSGAADTGGSHTRSATLPGTETLSFGGMDDSISNPSQPSAPTLSFGLQDGTISSTSLGDPWRPQPSSVEKKSWNSSNPWM